MEPAVKRILLHTSSNGRDVDGGSHAASDLGSLVSVAEHNQARDEIFTKLSSYRLGQKWSCGSSVLTLRLLRWGYRYFLRMHRQQRTRFKISINVVGSLCERTLLFSFQTDSTRCTRARGGRMNQALDVVNIQSRQASGDQMDQALQVVNVQFRQAKTRNACNPINPIADESCRNENSVALYTVSSILSSLKLSGTPTACFRSLIIS